MVTYSYDYGALARQNTQSPQGAIHSTRAQEHAACPVDWTRRGRQDGQIRESLHVHGYDGPIPQMTLPQECPSRNLQTWQDCFREEHPPLGSVVGFSQRRRKVGYPQDGDRSYALLSASLRWDISARIEQMAAETVNKRQLQRFRHSERVPARS